MRTYAMRWIVGLSLAMIGAACGPDPAPQDNNGDNNVGGNACERVEVEGVDYCVYRKQNIIIETGYDCPVDLVQRHQIGDDMIVCSGSMDPPAEPVVERIEELVPYMNNSTNNVTPGNNTTPLNNTSTGGRTCMDVESEHDALISGADTSCTTDADCKMISGGVCPLRQCGVPVNANVDAADIISLGEEFEQLSCNTGVDCAACPDEEAVCENNTCVAQFVSEERSCEDIEQDFEDAVLALDTTCTEDADCVSFTGSCQFGSDQFNVCELAANVNADRSALDDFTQEHDSTCGGPVACQQCAAPADAVCENNTCVVPAETPTSICEDVKQDFDDAVGALDTTCSVDADCKLVSGGICNLAQCQPSVNVNADALGLEPLEMQFLDNNCDNMGPVCNACPALEAFCDNNVCGTREVNP